MTKNTLLKKYEANIAQIGKTKWAMCRAIVKYGFYSPAMDTWLEECETNTYRIVRALLRRYGISVNFTFTPFK